MSKFRTVLILSCQITLGFSLICYKTERFYAKDMDESKLNETDDCGDEMICCVIVETYVPVNSGQKIVISYGCSLRQWCIERMPEEQMMEQLKSLSGFLDVSGVRLKDDSGIGIVANSCETDKCRPKLPKVPNMSSRALKEMTPPLSVRNGVSVGWNLGVFAGCCVLRVLWPVTRSNLFLKWGIKKWRRGRRSARSSLVFSIVPTFKICFYFNFPTVIRRSWSERDY